MNKLSLIVFSNIIIILLISCGENTEQKASYNELLAENNELRNDIALKDKRMYELVTTLNEVHRNLNRIDSARNNISAKATNFEGEISQKKKMLSSVENIEEMLINSQVRIGKLQKNIENQKQISSELKNMVKDLQPTLDNNSRKVRVLKEKVVSLQKEVKVKEEKIVNLQDSVGKSKKNIKKLSNEVETLNREYNKARQVYYLKGKENFLVEKGIIFKKGGFLGIGSKLQMKKNLNESNFEQSHIDELNTLKLNSNEIKLLPERPKQTYTIEGKVLRIEDESFWDYSRYLVIINY